MDYRARIKRLQDYLKEIPCDALLVDDATNVYYLTGLQLSQGMLLVHTLGASLLVDSRYFELCKQRSPVPVLLADQNNASLAKVLSNECAFVQTLAFDSENTSYKSYQNLQSCIHTVGNEKTPSLVLIPLANPIKTLRSIKDENEIQLLRTAAELGSRGFDHVCSLLKEGVSEIELAVELEIFWKRHGSKSLAFDPIIAFGPNSSMPHYRAGEATLKKGDTVLIDIGVNYQHYHSDMTRVVFFGKGHSQILNIYSIVHEAQLAALELCRPGTLIGDLDHAARNLIVSKGFGEKFTHSLGHGVGLEIHELPILRNTAPFKDLVLQPGMVITIEPGIYLPGLGGVRIEDTVVITKEGHENLTQRSKDLRFIK